MTQGTPRDGLSRRTLLASGAVTGLSSLAGCTGVRVQWVDRFDESDPLVGYNRIGTGQKELSYWTSTFYMPARSGNSEPELSPLTGPFYRTLERNSSQPAAAPALRAQHEEWARAHPDYRIGVSYRTSGDWRSDLITQAADGSPPGASSIDNPWITDLRSHLRPITNHVDNVDDFFPFVREVTMEDGELLAAWKYTDCRCLYYRQDLIDRYGNGTPPQTWEELIRLGSDISANQETAGFGLYPSTSTVIPFFWGQGGRLVNQAGAPVLSQAQNRRAMIRTLALLQRLIDTGAASQWTGDTDSYESLARQARTGQIGMFIGGSWQIEKDFKNQVQGDRWRRWRVAEIPMRDADQQVTAVGGWTEGTFVPREAPESGAIRDFVAKFVEPAAMGRYCEAAGLLPTRESLFEDRELFDPDALPYYRTFRRLLRHGRSPPAVPIYSTIDTAFERAMQAVLAGQATPQQATDAMIRRVQRQYERQQ
jgi:multiple sugar transport system substrate-binding protein